MVKNLKKLKKEFQKLLITQNVRKDIIWDQILDLLDNNVVNVNNHLNQLTDVLEDVIFIVLNVCNLTMILYGVVIVKKVWFHLQIQILLVILVQNLIKGDPVIFVLAKNISVPIVFLL